METAAEAVPFVSPQRKKAGEQKPKPQAKRPRKRTFDAQGRGSRGCGGSAPRTEMQNGLRAD